MKDYTTPSKPTGGKEKEKNDPAAEENNCATSKRSTRKIKVSKAASGEDNRAHLRRSTRRIKISKAAEEEAHCAPPKRSTSRIKVPKVSIKTDSDNLTPPCKHWLEASKKT